VQGSGGAAAAMSPARVRLTPRRASGRAAVRGGTIFLEARCTSSDVRRGCPFPPSGQLRWSDEVEWCSAGCVYRPARQLLSHCAELSAAIKYENGISTLTGMIMLCIRFYLFPAIGRASKKDLTGTYFDSSLVLMITSNNMLRIKFDSLIILKRIL